jgi:hypothetical protein
VQIGAATACSTATTVMPSSGCTFALQSHPGSVR